MIKWLLKYLFGIYKDTINEYYAGNDPYIENDKFVYTVTFIRSVTKYYCFWIHYDTVWSPIRYINK